MYQHKWLWKYET